MCKYSNLKGQSDSMMSKEKMRSNLIFSKLHNRSKVIVVLLMLDICLLDLTWGIFFAKNNIRLKDYMTLMKLHWGASMKVSNLQIVVVVLN
jgi:hypothetical protein